MTKIDAVITWVDGNDPEFNKLKNSYLEKELKTKGVQPFGVLDTRFRDIGELEFCIKLIRKNLDFIDTVYIVTNGQKPIFLNEEFAAQYNSKLVSHSTIFGTRYKEFLPVFNSQSIEAMLPRIPNLSERFLYFNDDFFIAKHTKLESFFLGDKIISHGAYRFKNIWLDRIHRAINNKFYVSTVGLRKESKLFPRKLLYFSPSHAPYAIEKIKLEEAIQEWGGYESIIKFKFRNELQPWPIGLYINKMASENKIIYKDCKNIGYYHGVQDGKFDFKLTDNIEMFSLQSLDTLSEIEKDKAVSFLTKLSN